MEEEKITPIEEIKKEQDHIFNTFCVNKHFLDWLLRAMVIILSPIYMVFTIVVGTCFGLVKIFMLNINNLWVVYGKLDDKAKPIVKWSSIIVGGIIIIGIITLIVLKCNHII